MTQQGHYDYRIIIGITLVSAMGGFLFIRTGCRRPGEKAWNRSNKV